MKLVPFQPEYLRLHDPLPFGLRNGEGRLLLAAGQSVPTAFRLEDLKRQRLFAEESESADWYRRLGAAVDHAIRNGQSLQSLLVVRPESPPQRDAGTGTPASWGEQWDEAISQLESALRQAPADAAWRSRLDAVHAKARSLFQRRPDASLYWLVHEATHSKGHYSARHALLVMGICEQAAAVLEWSQDWVDSLGRAALVINASILKVQDQLALVKLPLSPAAAAELAGHALASAAMLEAVIDDALCIEVLQLQGPAAPPQPIPADSPAAQQLAELLRRVDGLTTAFSLFGARMPKAPLQAIREFCLMVDGRPDVLSGALLKAIGLYPPGCFVKLAGGELAVVVARGPRANQPRVAALVGSSGLPLLEPAVRDTSDARYAVKGPVLAHTVKVRPPHAKLLALR